MNGIPEAFSHNVGVVTPEEQERLQESTVGIAGVGGVGGNVAHILARTGVGRFVLADPDTFSESNINRQFGAYVDTVGRKKVDVTAELIRSVNPRAEITVMDEGITPETAEEFVDSVDVVVDAIDFDRPDVRKSLLAAARRARVYSFLCPAFGFGASLVVFSPDGPSYEELFGSPEDGTLGSLMKYSRRILPVIPSYIDVESYLKGLAGKSHLPTFSPSVMLAAALTATDVVLLVVGRREPVCLPKVKWLDLVECTMKVVDTDRFSLRRLLRMAAVGMRRRNA